MHRAVRGVRRNYHSYTKLAAARYPDAARQLQPLTDVLAKPKIWATTAVLAVVTILAVNIATQTQQTPQSSAAPQRPPYAMGCEAGATNVTTAAAVRSEVAAGRNVCVTANVGNVNLSAITRPTDVIVSTDSGGSMGSVNMNGSSHIIIRQARVRSVDARATSFVTIEKSTIGGTSDNRVTGHLITALGYQPGIDTANDLTIQDNEIAWTRVEMTGGNADNGDWAFGIRIYGGDRIKILRNYIHEIAGDGIQIGSSGSDNIIDRNEIGPLGTVPTNSREHSDTIQITGNGPNMQITNNWLHHQGYYDGTTNVTGNSGIPYIHGGDSDALLVENNLIEDSRGRAEVCGLGDGSTARSNITVRNNTFRNLGQIGLAGFEWDCDSGSGNTITRNIAVDARGGFDQGGNSASFTQSHNIWGQPNAVTFDSEGNCTSAECNPADEPEIGYRCPVGVWWCAAAEQQPVASAAPTITELPTPGLYPSGITEGPDGNIWFTDESNNLIGKMTPNGVVTTYPIPTGNSMPREITAGPDGNLWFTEFYFFGNKIGKITPAGEITEYQIPTSFSLPVGITAGPDGNIWFTESLSGYVGKLNPSNGQITEYMDGISMGANSYDIISGGDGNMWFSQYGGGETTPARIARLTTDGAAAEFNLVPSGVAADAGVHGLAWGSDNNLWFTQFNYSKLGRLNPANGVVTEFADGLTPNSRPGSIVAAPDGNLWFTESAVDNIGMITTDGEITEYPIAQSSGADGITVGPDDNVWFAARNGGYIGRVELASGTDTEPPTTVSDLNAEVVSQTDINVSWQAATDNVGIEGYRVLYAQGAVDPATLAQIHGTTTNTTYALSGLACGTTYTIAIEVYDQAGNVSDKTDAASTETTQDCIEPDTTPPDTTITSRTTNGTLELGSITAVPTAFFEFTASEVDVTFACEIDNNGYAACDSGSINYSNLAAGAHTFRVRATDAAGNPDLTPAEFSWTRDSTAPSVTMQTPVNGSRVRGDNLPISATATDSGGGVVQSVQFKRCNSSGFSCVNLGAAVPLSEASGTPPTLFSTVWNSSALSDGGYTLEATAIDSAGNTTTAANFAVTVDNTAPEAAITPNVTAVTRQTAASFTMTSSEPDGATFRCALDNASNLTTCANPRSYTSLAAGQHTFYAQAVDTAGNVSPITSFAWTIDLTAPQTVLNRTNLPTGSTTDRSIAFSFNANGESGASFACKLDKPSGVGSYASCTSPKSYTNSDLSALGSYKFSVRATDAAGNVDQTPEEFSWIIISDSPEPEAPDTTITDKPAITTDAASATFKFSSSIANSSFFCDIDSKGAASCNSGSITYDSLTPGQHTFAVYAVAPGNNRDISPAIFTWTVNAPPASKPKKVGDLDGNDRVQLRDLSMLLARWGQGAGSIADLDGNGTVNLRDLSMLLARWEG